MVWQGFKMDHARVVAEQAKHVANRLAETDDSFRWNPSGSDITYYRWMLYISQDESGFERLIQKGNGEFEYQAEGTGVKRSLDEDITWSNYILPALRRAQDADDEQRRGSGSSKLRPELPGIVFRHES